MKKLSKPGKQMPEETIGIDLGDKMSRYCIVNREGEVIEEGSFRNQASSLAKHFSGEPRTMPNNNIVRSSEITRMIWKPNSNWQISSSTTTHRAAAQ